MYKYMYMYIPGVLQLHTCISKYVNYVHVHVHVYVHVHYMEVADIPETVFGIHDHYYSYSYFDCSKSLH